jgi:hypothetical protein
MSNTATFGSSQYNVAFLFRHNDPMAFIDACKGRVLFIDEA